tara:strand:- start:4365 stop:5117 length:753 start_codon:yes stop_codon:yes gene_type:complete
MSRWKAICSYDGTDFAGWQSQSTRNAVQDAIEIALESVLRQSIRIHGAGRTDAGVHAHAQSFHFDHEWNHSGESLVRAVNTKLPSSLRLISILPAPDDFHARFSARGKCYEYHLSQLPPDPFSVRYCWHISTPFHADRVREVLPTFAGSHNFTAFAGKVVDAENPIKTLEAPKLISAGEGRWILQVKGNGFLYRMVRSLAGTLVRVASGKLDPQRIQELLENPVRTPEVHTAPACGLFLKEVFYENAPGD